MRKELLRIVFELKSSAYAKEKKEREKQVKLERIRKHVSEKWYLAEKLTEKRELKKSPDGR